jgi:CHAD domain-containing protein
MALIPSSLNFIEDPLKKINEICLSEKELLSMAKPNGVKLREAEEIIERSFFDTPKGDLIKKSRLFYSEMSSGKTSLFFVGENGKLILAQVPDAFKKDVFKIFEIRGKRRKGSAKLKDGSSIPVDSLFDMKARNPYTGREAKIGNYYEARLSGLETIPSPLNGSAYSQDEKLDLAGLMPKLGLPFVSDAFKAGFSISEEDDCGTALRRLARKELNKIRGFRPFVLAGLDPEFLHEMRVATRRLRSYLRIFSPVFGTKRSISLSITAASFGLDLGRVRDLDVFSEKLRGWLGEIIPDGAEINSHVKRFLVKRDGEFEILERVLRSRKFEDFMTRIENLSKDRIGRNIYSRESFELQSLKSMKMFKNEVKKRARKYFSSPEPFYLHRTRIAFKRYRYLVEILEPFFVDESKAYRKTLVEIQDTLGNYQDLKVAEALIDDELKNMEEKEALILFGSLKQLLKTKSKEEEIRFHKIFKDFKRMKDPKIRKGGRK